MMSKTPCFEPPYKHSELIRTHPKIPGWCVRVFASPLALPNACGRDGKPTREFGR